MFCAIFYTFFFSFWTFLSLQSNEKIHDFDFEMLAIASQGLVKLGDLA